MAENAGEHTVKITAYFERERDGFLLKAPTTYAVIEVQPPIDPGDEFAFKRTVLGREWCLVDLRKLFANAKAAVFMAESSIPDQDQRHEDIAVIARRIGQLANNPKSALTMMEDRPFPEQQMSGPGLEIAKELPLSDEESLVNTAPEDKQMSETTVHLKPVEVPPLTVGVPPLADLEKVAVRSDDLSAVDVPGPVEVEEPAQPSVFGPVAAKLTGFAPVAPSLPWPPQASDGRHARKEQTDN